MNDFHERLARIEAGGLNTRHTLFVGMDETFVVAQQQQRRTSQKAISVVQNASYPATLLAAVVMSMLSVVAVKLLHFHLLGGVALGSEPHNEMAIFLVLSVLLSFGLARWLWEDHNRLRGYMATGVLIMIVGGHNFVHMAPRAWGILFSDMWVAQVLAQTEYRSIVIRNYSIPF